jgi:hypothetical protein
MTGGMMGGMGPDLAELSSIASTLAQLSRRIGAMADVAVQEKQERVASDLVAVERALAGAERRLARLCDR